MSNADGVLRADPMETLVLSLSYLVCPLCKGTLKNESANQVKCLSCKSAYSVDDGIPILLSPQLGKFKMSEAEFHSKAANEHVDRHMKFSYRVARYHNDYLKCFCDCQKGALVLEVGGGGGLESVHLKNMGLTLIESDISVGMVKTSRKRAIVAGQESNSVFVVCDAEQLPCKDQSLDAVLIVGTLHHLPSPQRFFAEARHALKPGGLLVIGFEPNRWPYFTVYPAMYFLGRILHLYRRTLPGEVSIGDKETTGFVEADFERFLKAEGLNKVSLQRIWYIDGYIQLILGYINKNRSVAKLVDLPNVLQRMIVACDNFLSHIPLLRRFCFHWTLVAHRPKTDNGDLSIDKERS